VIVTREVDSNSANASNSMQGVRSDLILANIRVLAIDQATGTLAFTGETVAVPAPVCVMFAP